MRVWENLRESVRNVKKSGRVGQSVSESGESVSALLYARFARATASGRIWGESGGNLGESGGIWGESGRVWENLGESGRIWESLGESRRGGVLESLGEQN